MDARLPGAAAERVRAARPLVQCVTNFVAMDITANVLLAAGAAPAMVHAEREAADFAAHRSALLVNTGTLDPAWMGGMEAAIAAATDASTAAPWVLDPVGVGATAARTRACVRLAALKPTAIKANASEIVALATAMGFDGGKGLGGPRGVDSTISDTAAARPAARHLAAETGAIIIITGKIDRIVDSVDDGGRPVLGVVGGSPLLTAVTATGCALGALIAAYLAAAPRHALSNRHPDGDLHAGASVGAVAAAHACAAFGAAAAAAETASSGPGTFRATLIDALHNQRARDIDESVGVAPDWDE